MKGLRELLVQKERVVAGLMSGTSVDGVDAVIARLTGTGRALQIQTLGAAHLPYRPEVRELILGCSRLGASSVTAVSQLNFLLAHLYSDAVKQALASARWKLSDLDLIGSHGQTIAHLPEPTACAGHLVRSTLQIGDPSVLANLLGVVTVGDFRVADVALDGQGAPLVPYFDYLCFAHAEENRGLLNLGGIANLTVLPKGESARDVYAFDTGPANMLLDLIARRFFGVDYDQEGALAAQGKVSEALLGPLLADPFFRQPPPKSTGRDRYGEALLDPMLAQATALALSPHDVLATAVALTARSVRLAYELFIAHQHPLHALIVSGGGIHHRPLRAALAQAFDPIPVRTTDEYGVDPVTKEALCFAVLAHETLNGAPTNLPSVTGASRATLLGKICVPLE